MVINASENSLEKKYIQDIKFNGKEYTKNWLSYSELMKGAVIDFKLSETPNVLRGVSEADLL